MILKFFRSISVALCTGCFATSAVASAAGDEALIAAFDAYRAGDAIKFSRLAKKLEGHVLAPWLEYWRLSFSLEDASSAEIAAYFARYGATYPGERLRTDWLKVLGKRRAWPEFDQHSPALAREDLEIRCYRLNARLARGDQPSAAEFALVWNEPRELPEGCARFTDALAEHGGVSVTDVWQRVRVLFEAGAITAAKNTLGYLPKSEGPDERALAEAARTPKRLIDRLPKTLEQRSAREVAVLAASRLAKSDVNAAAAALEGTLGERLPQRELKYLWGRIAAEAARQHHDLALRWYGRAADA